MGDYLNAVIHSFSVLMDPSIVLLVCIGSIGGIVFGAIPGLSVPMAVAVTLPFTYGMTPMQGLATMCGVYIGGMSGGLVSAILIGIPGTPGAVSTVFDGFPMARKGEGGMALGIGIWASFFGGLLGCLVLMFSAPGIANAALKFGPWELFSLIVFGMTILATIGGGSVIKGLVSGVLGMIAGTVGADPIFNEGRMMFGFNILMGGIPFVPAMIGMYAVSQLMQDVEKTESWTADPPKTDKTPRIPVWRSAIVTLKHYKETLFATGVGVFIGALPGAGSIISNIFAYDQIKKFSKHPEKFGTGIPEGIIASEAANSSVAGGSLIPMITLGIPGNAISAIMMGAVVLHGIQPGPLFISTQPELAYGLFMAFVFANFSVLLIQIYFVRIAVFFLRISRALLAPVIFVFCVVGAYSVSYRLFDLYLVAISGIIAYIMVKLKVPLAPFVLGLVLTPIAETNMRVALMTDPNPWLFTTRPISLFFLILSLISIGWTIKSSKPHKQGV
ncbi:MAG: tripartite tricarboxylate transporter permease [Thermodesulfobacteriota bacterium]